jgi:hypothetical protein
MQQRKPIDQCSPTTHPWTEDPVAAYKKFLEYAGSNLRAGVDYNPTLFGSPVDEKSELKVDAKNGKFNTLRTALNLPLCCSKITIRNLNKAFLLFNFREDILPGIIDVRADLDDVGIDTVNIAQRNIVPREVAQVRSLAKRMDYNEYLIDGKDYKKDVSLIFSANRDFNQTPIQIVLENCRGFITVYGLEETALAKVFEDKNPFSHMFDSYSQTLPRQYCK